jgi:hypothetical protein
MTAGVALIWRPRRAAIDHKEDMQAVRYCRILQYVYICECRWGGFLTKRTVIIISERTDNENLQKNKIFKI